MGRRLAQLDGGPPAAAEGAEDASEAALSASDRRHLLAVACGCGFVTLACFLGLTPLYPEIAGDLGLTAAGLGAVLGWFMFAAAFLQIPIGVAIDRYGYRRLLAIGLTAMSASQAVRWQVGGSLSFGVVQGLFAIGAQLVMSAGYAAVARAHATGGQAYAMGTLTASAYLGQGSGYLIAGALGPWLGWRGLSLVLASLPLVMLAASQRLPPQPHAAATATAPVAGIVAAVHWLALPAALSLAAVAALVQGCGYAAPYLVPFSAQREALGPGAASLLLLPFVGGCIIGAPLTGRLADRLGARPPLVACLLASAVAMLAMAIAGRSPLVAAAGLLVVGFAVASALGLTATLMVDLSRRLAFGTGAALAGLWLCQSLGPALGPVVSGTLFVHWGLGVAYAQIAADLLVAAALAAVAGRLAARYRQLSA